MKGQIKSIVTILFLLIILPLTFYLTKNIQKYLSRAVFLPANIVVNAGKPQGPLSSPWRALAQGGEIDEDRKTPVYFSEITSQISSLSPKYIRLDHLYDFYHIISKNPDGSLSYQWSELDRVVNDILKAKALPYLSLSYMPPAIARDGDIIGLPDSWSNWQSVVAETIRHYSGRNQKNLNNVYYEVWNEPDLFGQWKIGGSKDYRLLYQYAVLGANSVTNVNNFYIGGPATTHPMKVWTSDFLTYLQQNNLRIDFLSWHRYSFDPGQFDRDLNEINSWLSSIPRYQNLPKIISEWGSDSENNPSHDSYFDAIHTLAVVRQIIDRIQLAFTFEIKDGPGPQDKKYWGRWGIFTHQKFGTTAKPRYYALQFLENLKGERLSLTGEGSDITGIAVKDNNTYKVMLINYSSSRSGKQEAVPIKITNLANGIYSYKETGFLGKSSNGAVKVRNGLLDKLIYLPVNQATILEFTKISDLITFEKGLFGQALVFDQDNPALDLTINRDLTAGTVEFWLNNDFDGALISEQFFIDLPIEDNRRLIAKKDLSGFGNVIKYGLFENGQEINTVSLDITQWKENDWHYVSFGWQTENDEDFKLSLTVDEKSVNKSFSDQKIGLINHFFIGGYKGLIEELRISDINRDPKNNLSNVLSEDKNTVLLKHFDGSI